MKKSFGKKAALLLVPALGAWFVRLWFATCRIREHEAFWKDQAEQTGRPIVGTCWHYCILGVFAIYRNYPVVLLISASDDGELLARMAGRLGFPVVRGSSNRKGVAAAKELIRELRRGKNAGLVADGSQGPERIAQSGPLLLAARSKGTVLPVLYSSSSYFVFKTWDRLILPKPFSRLDVFYGKPLEIPEDVRPGDLEEYRGILEERLNGLYTRAWQEQGKEKH